MVKARVDGWVHGVKTYGDVVLGYRNDAVNSLTTAGYLLGVFFRLWIPFLVRISTSAWSQHWKLELKLLRHNLLGFMTLITPTH